jgi:putative oxidoreductase
MTAGGPRIDRARFAVTEWDVHAYSFRRDNMGESRIRMLATRWEPVAFAALRIVVGLMFTFHGVQKIFGWHAGAMPPVGSQLWIGGLIELAAGLLVASGWFTRPAAFVSSGQMAVAYIQFHWKLAFANAMWVPALNKGEPAVLYCFVFLFIAAHGAGIVSVDGRGRRE